MNQFAGYTPYFGSAMKSYEPNQQMPQYSDALIQKLLGQQVQQQIMGSFAPQGMGQDELLAMLGGTAPSAPPAPVLPPALPVVKKPKPKPVQQTEQYYGQEQYPPFNTYGGGFI